MEPLSEFTLTIQQAYELAIQRHEEGDWEDAESLCRQILEHEPGHPAGLHLQRVLATSYFQRGNELCLAGDARKAIPAYQRALTLRPNDPEILNNLGNAFQQTREPFKAVEAYRQALKIRPDYAGAWNNLGRALELTGSLDDAAEAYRKAIALRPDFPEAHYNLGNALRSPDRVDESITEYRRALALRPDHAATLGNLGNALKDSGLLDEAIACYRRAWELDADARTAGNLLYCLYLHSDYSPEQIYNEHLRWNQRYAKPLAPPAPFQSTDRTHDRKLRIGYVSPDLREHPVGRFMLPLLSHHDHGRFEIFCYADGRADHFTEQLRRHADVWKETTELSDEEMAAVIRHDQIDVLIDLAMHTSGNRLLVFARKPAPVQATYLSYCGTTGLETMDYRLTDPHLDPPGTAEYYCEKSIHLPKTFWCYGAPEDSPPVAPPPALTRGHVTFGCLNQFCKISKPALATWCELLRQLPNSRLVLLAPQGSPRDRTLRALTDEGIEPRRVRFADRAPLREYLDQHREIDIALDPFPFAGGTTTCDALWMGVPVVTLSGQTAVSRAGASILSNVGFAGLISHSPQEYVQIAASLAGDLQRLARMRSELRKKMIGSPLMDANGFAKAVQQALLKMVPDGSNSPGQFDSMEARRPRS